jgi:hypothetical protein
VMGHMKARLEDLTRPCDGTYEGQTGGSDEAM